MARIRTIKPTAFTSRSLAAVSIPARWLFAGLWTYCDDEGRADAEPRLIKAAIFPLDDDVTPAQVISWLDELVREGMVRLYEVDGRGYLRVVHWVHQKISHPTASSLPEEPSPVIPELSVNPPETLRPDRDLDRDRDREQGGGRAPAREDAPTSQTLLAEWIETCPKRPPSNVIGQIGKIATQLLAEGIDTDDIRRGLAAWASKGLHPSTLPSVVNEVMNAPIRGRPNGRSTTDDRVNQALALAEHFESLEPTRKAIR